MTLKSNRASLVFIFLTVFIDLLGVGIVLPLLPFYVKLIEETGTPWLAANHALIVGALTASYSLFQFLFAPILGGLSDRFGRRPVLLLSLLGAAFSYVLFGFADSLRGFGAEAVLAVLFVSRIIAGITGGSISAAQAYIADVTPPQERARGMGLIGAAFGLGFMLGPAMGGLLSLISLSAPAFVAAALVFASVVFGYFRLPESLPVERRAEQAQSINPFKRLRAVIGLEVIRPLLLGVVLLNFAFAGLQSNFAVFANTRFGFGPTDIAFVFAFIGLVAIVMQGFLIRKLVPRFGEARLAVSGLTLMAGLRDDRLRPRRLDALPGHRGPCHWQRHGHTQPDQPDLAARLATGPGVGPGRCAIAQQPDDGDRAVVRRRRVRCLRAGGAVPVGSAGGDGGCRGAGAVPAARPGPGRAGRAGRAGRGRARGRAIGRRALLPELVWG